MKNNKIIAITAIAIILIAGIAGAFILAQNEDSDGNTLTDMRGRKVTIPDTIDSIIGFSSCSLELISFFSAVNNVTYLDTNENFNDGGRTHSFAMKSKLQNLPRVDPNNHEAVASTGADLIIASTIEVSALNNNQEKYGIPVFAINADLEFGPEFDKQIELLGKLFNEENRAKEITSGIKELIDSIQNNVPDVSDLSGYACGMNFYGSGSISFLKTSGDYLPFIYSKITNISIPNTNEPGKQPYVTADHERVLNEKPDFIFIDDVGVSSCIAYINSNKALFETYNVSAVVNGDIYKTLTYKSWGTNWQNQLINIYYVAKVIHGDVLVWEFEDKADKILQLFYPNEVASGELSYEKLANAQTNGGCSKVSL